jgi:RNA polymerase sigma-70 factor (ECF subfamily)
MDLGERVRSGLAAGAVDEAATAALEGHGPAILGYLCTLLGDDDARDVFSTWAEDVWRGLPGFRFECSLRTWVYRLAWHAVQRFRRDPYRRRAQPLPDSAASRLAVSIAASGMAPGSRRDRLRRLREGLPPEDQTLLVLRIDRELEWEEIALVLSAEAAPVTSTGLRKRFERLKDRLRRTAEEEGLLDGPPAPAPPPPSPPRRAKS